MTHHLSIRKTHRYVGTCSHLDEWDDLGTCKVIGREDITPEYETEDDYMTEPRCERLTVRVDAEEGATEELIKQAIRDVFTSHDCHHDYDCCGCRSYYARKIEHLGGPVWQLNVTSSRNY